MSYDPSIYMQVVKAHQAEKMPVVNEEKGDHVILPEDSIAGPTDFRSGDKITGTGEGAETRPQRPEVY